ncbi:hypothetical protein G6F57_016583 [Rhizopus arrhizus]|nr:hypothetical protein G6F57_016583 [Rhizopus arrhizus]
MGARQHCAQAVERRPVAHQHMAAGGDFQRAGAGPLEGTVENVTARRHPRHIQRIAVQEQIAGRGSRGHARGKVVSVGRRHVQLRAVIGAGGHDVASSHHPHRARGRVPGLPQVGARDDRQRFTAAQPHDIAVPGIQARDLAGPGRAGRGRIEVEQREVRVTGAGDAVGTLVAQGDGTGGLRGIARERRCQHVGHAGRIGPRAVDGVAARVDRITRQQLELAARAGRQRQRIRQAAVLGVQVARRDARVDAAVIRGGAQDRGVQITRIRRGRVAAGLQRQALGAVRRLPAGRQITARAGQFTGGVGRPHRKPAVAAAIDLRAGAQPERRAVLQRDTAGIAGAAHYQPPVALASEDS